MQKYVMALDAGTTSNRCILFNEKGEICSCGAAENFMQYFPKPGWVEHDADEIWASMLGVAVEAMNKIGADSTLISAAIGIYKSAGNCHRLGQKYRRAGLSRNRLAVPQNLRIL